MSKFAATAIPVAALMFMSTITLADEAATPLLKQELQGTGAMEANMALIEVSPGHQTERHMHPGHVFLYVLEGEVEIDVDGEPPLRLSAGEAGYELPNRPMVGKNLSSTNGARLIVFQIGEAGKPMQVPSPN